MKEKAIRWTNWIREQELEALDPCFYRTLKNDSDKEMELIVDKVFDPLKKRIKNSWQTVKYFR